MPPHRDPRCGGGRRSAAEVATSPRYVEGVTLNVTAETDDCRVALTLRIRNGCAARDSNPEPAD